MTYEIETNSVDWLVGGQVEAAKAAMRQIDTQYCIQILGDDKLVTLEKWTLMKEIQSALVNLNADKLPKGSVIQKIVEAIIEAANSNNENLKRELGLLKNFTVSPGNVLSVGDFTRAFADIIAEASAADSQLLNDINKIRASLSDNNAFNKKTNRIRVKRWDVNNRLPSLGINHWRLPPEDVLGAIDRLYGYYECADISGSTTDAVFSHAVFNIGKDTYDDSTVDKLKAAITKFINSGNGVVALAPIVAQMHHSLPECMMALNLMPEIYSKNGDNEFIDYSPFLTHVLQFEENQQIAKHMREWRWARTTAFNGSNRTIEKGFFRTLIVLQDVYQMSNRPNSNNEVAITFSFTYGSTKSSSYDFYTGFYNEIVEILEVNPFGPAVPLSKLAGALINYVNTFCNFGTIEMPNDVAVRNALDTQAKIGNSINMTGYSQSIKDLKIERM